MNWAAVIVLLVFLLGWLSGVRALVLGRNALEPLQGGAAFFGVLIYSLWTAFIVWMFVLAVNY